MNTLIIPGVQKCGTSTLYSLLGGHPRIVPSWKTETEYFTYSGGKNLFEYEKYFKRGDYEWRLDVSPGYFVSPCAPEQIAKIVPNARFIFVFRDPVQRAWSAWKMQQTKGSDLDSFNRSIKSHRHYLEHGRYATHLRRFMALFPKENMLFLRTEDLRSENAELFEKLSHFLGLDSFDVVDLKRENTGGMPRSFLISRMLNLFFKARNSMQNGAFGNIVSHPVIDRGARRLRNRIAEWNRISGLDNGPDMESFEFIRNSLFKELRELESITGLDLSDWARFPES